MSKCSACGWTSITLPSVCSSISQKSWFTLIIPRSTCLTKCRFCERALCWKLISPSSQSYCRKSKCLPKFSFHLLLWSKWRFLLPSKKHINLAFLLFLRIITMTTSAERGLGHFSVNTQNSSSLVSMLIRARIELIFFTVVHVVIYFGFMMKTVLITQGYFGYCWVVITQHEGFFCFSCCPVGE